MARVRVDRRAFRRVRHRLRKTFAMGRANAGRDGFGRGKRHHGRDRPATEAFRNPARLVDQIDVGTDRTATEGELTEGEMHKIDDEAKAIAQDAWDFADSSPEPPLEKLYTDVYADTSS